MPARRGLVTARLDFLERGWGGLEPFDEILYEKISKTGVHTHISTDHYHYWELGGEGYLQSFDTFTAIRGQECDRFSYRTITERPEKIKGFYWDEYEEGIANYKSINDYPSVRTFLDAVKFIEEKKDEDFFLQVEAFDPHQPFSMPQEYKDMFGIDDSNFHYNCPFDGDVTDDIHDIEHIRNMYKANLAFADYGVGLLLESLKGNKVFDECEIIFTTDHGYLLGEHMQYGKVNSHPYNEVTEIPLFHKIRNQCTREDVQGLTQLIDVSATIAELNNTSFSKAHGKSYLNMLENPKEPIRNAIISGFHGKSVLYRNLDFSLINGVKNSDNHPCFEYKATPTTYHSFMQFDSKDNVCLGYHLEHANYPVTRYKKSNEGKVNHSIKNVMSTEVYTNEKFHQSDVILDSKINRNLRKELISLLKDFGAPEEQYIRLGLDKLY